MALPPKYPVSQAPAKAFPQTLPRAVIFDWDNTLVDSWLVLHEALNGTLRAFGVSPWTFNETRRRIARSLRDSFPELFKGQWKPARDDFYARFEAIHLERLTPLPGAVSLLKTLHRRGIYMAVVSNKKGSLLRREATHLGWNGYFAHIIGADDCPHDKPAPDPVIRALEGSPHRQDGSVWFVGDSPIDMKCALNSGCAGILLHHDRAGNDMFSPPPAFQFDDCPSLDHFIQGANEAML